MGCFLEHAMDHHVNYRIRRGFCEALAILAITAMNVMAGVSEKQDEQTRLIRGAKVREALLQMIERVDAQEVWPQQFASASEELGLVYERPNGITEDTRDLTVVVHEQIERHPKGVWVGYADGHMEFAASGEGLAWCMEQIAIAKRGIAKYG